MAVTLNNSQLSAGLYSAFWNRAPDYTGQQFWVGQLNGGANILDVATFFYNSEEGLAAYPNWMRAGTPAANAELITAVYENVFERQPDAGGLAFWTAQLNSGAYTFPEVVLGMMNTAIAGAAEGNTDGMQFLNEIQVGIFVAETLRTNDPAITSIALQGVTYEQSSVYIREAQLAEMVDPANTYTLTTNIDVATAQYFDGSLNTFGQQTLQNFDELTGQKSFNVLDAEIVQNVTPAVLDNIQLVEITNLTSASPRTISLLNANAVEAVVNDGSLGDLTFSNVGDTLEAVGVANLLTAQNTTVTFSSTAAVTELDLAFENVAGGTVTIANVETVNVFSEVEDSTATLALADATALTFAGEANLTATLAAATNGVSSVDASSMEGDLNLTFVAQTQVLSTTDISVVGGNGDDTFTVSALTQDYTITLGAGNDTVVDTAIGNNDSIEGGEGVDTLSTTYVQAAALTTANGVNGIDVLELTTALNGTLTTATVDSTIDTLSVAVAGALTAAASTVTGSAGEFTVNLGASGAGNTGALANALTVTDTGTGTTDTLNINNVAVNSTNNTNVNVFAAQDVTSTGYENVTISTGDASPTTQTISTLTITVDSPAGLPSAAASLTVDGSSALTIDTSLTTNSTGLLTVDASALNVLTTANGLRIDAISQGVGGTASITGSAGADTVVTGNFASTVYGGTGNDVLTGGTAADQLHGEAGNDTLTGSGGNDTIRGGEGNDTISAIVAGVVDIDGGSGNDTVSLAATLAATDTVNGGEGVDTLSVTAAITGTTGVGVTNFEILQTTVDQAMTNTVNNNGWTTVYASGGSAVNITNALAAVQTFQIDSSAASESFARLVDTEADTLTIQQVGTAPANTTITTFTADGEDSITVDVSAGTAASYTLTIGNLAAAALDVLSVTGDNNVAITTVTGATGLDTITNSLTGTATFSVDGSASTSAVTFTANGGSTGRSTVTTGSGADVITAALAAELYATGGSGNDTITGGNLADSLSGGAGADVLTATAGADTLVGGAGADTIVGGTDLLSTFSAVDMNAAAIDGGITTSVGAVVNLGSTTLTAAAINTATGLFTSANDLNVAANTTAYLASTSGLGLAATQDTLSNIRIVAGSTGTDYIVGSASADTLSGAAGADTISGGSGNDVITGGTGADNMTGGAGSDSFAYANLAAVALDTGILIATADLVTDFVSGTDVISTGTAGTALNYVEAATAATFAAALTAANVVFTADPTVTYYLTASTADAVGLLFVNTDGGATADAVIKLTGITSANFAFTDIV